MRRRRLVFDRNGIPVYQRRYRSVAQVGTAWVAASLLAQRAEYPAQVFTLFTEGC